MNIIRALWRERRGLAGGLLALLAAAGLSGALAQRALPRRIPWRQDWKNHVEAQAYREHIPVVTPGQAREYVAAGRGGVLDARPAADFARGHLPGARSLPWETKEGSFFDVAAELTAARPLLVYCSDPTCDDSLQLARFLRAQGFTNVVLFAGGWRAWQAQEAAR